MRRFKSLDVLRGITIALMILVNSPGHAIAYPWLEHSPWNGCTFADLVFPFFIVIVGVSAVLALTQLKTRGWSNKQLCITISKRGLYLFLMGLLLNAFPHHFDVDTIRILGVLQRIAICYVVTALLFLSTSFRTQILLAIALLVGYALLLAGFPTPDPLTDTDNIVGYVDRILLGTSHLYSAGFDPEGLLSTIPAIAQALLGNVLGICLLRGYRMKWIMLAGVILSLLGLACGFILPINKSLWSSSYVLFTTGLCYIAFGLCYIVIEVKHWTRWSKPFELFGKHALLVYMLHVLGLKIQAMITVNVADGKVVKLREYITQTLFGHFSPDLASLCYAIMYTVLWWGVLWMLFNKPSPQPSPASGRGG